MNLKISNLKGNSKKSQSQIAKSIEDGNLRKSTCYSSFYTSFTISYVMSFKT